MNKEEAKAYALKIAKESGVADEVATQIATAFDNDKFFNGFVPRPEVDRSLQSERQKYQQVEQRNNYLETEWYPAAKQTYERAKQIEGQLAKYQQLYGDIDPNDPNATRHAAAATGIDESRVLELLKQHISPALSSQGESLIDLFRINNDHMTRFKKPIDVDSFDQHVAQQRKAGRNDSLNALYKDWIQPEVEKVTNESIEARLKAAREEGAKDFASRHKIPVDPRPREAHVLFDRKESDSKTPSDRSGREAFLEVMLDPDPDTVKARYPVT